MSLQRFKQITAAALAGDLDPSDWRRVAVWAHLRAIPLSPFEAQNLAQYLVSLLKVQRKAREYAQAG